MSGTLDALLEDRFWDGLREAERFFMGQADVQVALERLARTFDELGIPYAVVGAMALNEWGYRRVTVDIDVLLNEAGLRRAREALIGRGYVEKFPGRRGFRSLSLPREMAEKLDPSVRTKFDELWTAAQGGGPER